MALNYLNHKNRITIGQFPCKIAEYKEKVIQKKEMSGIDHYNKQD